MSKSIESFKGENPRTFQNSREMAHLGLGFVQSPQQQGLGRPGIIVIVVIVIIILVVVVIVGVVVGSNFAGPLQLQVPPSCAARAYKDSLFPRGEI
jgi:hypothetical protein